jgi:hypothetical protein
MADDFDIEAYLEAQVDVSSLLKLFWCVINIYDRLPRTNQTLMIPEGNNT